MTPGEFLLRLIERLDHGSSHAVVALVAASSLAEHVFPPVPGDLGVTVGAAVAFARGWFVPAVFFAAVAGSVAGSSLAWLFGRWLETRTHHPKHPWVARAHDRALAATAALDRHGAGLIVACRFLPAVRAFVVVAAGFRRMALPKVLGAAALGAALWDAALFTVAALVGRNLPALARWLDAYNRLALALLAALALALAARWWWRRRRAAP